MMKQDLRLSLLGPYHEGGTAMVIRYIILLFAHNMPPPIVGVINPTKRQSYRNFEKRRGGKKGIHQEKEHRYIKRGCRHK